MPPFTAADLINDRVLPSCARRLSKREAVEEHRRLEPMCKSRRRLLHVRAGLGLQSRSDRDARRELVRLRDRLADD
jgi:hypothetical protein